MKLLTDIVLSIWIALTITTLTEGLDGTFQIRHPHGDDYSTTTEKRQLSAWTTLTNFWERAKCRVKLRTCRRITQGKIPPPLDAWAARVSSLSGGGNTALVQSLQDAITKAQSVDMTVIINALKTPIADAVDKDALLEQAKAIKAEAQAILKTSSALTVDGVPKLVEQMQEVLNATSALAQNVYRQPDTLLDPIFEFFAGLGLLYLLLLFGVCCRGDNTDCNPFCMFFALIPSIPFIVLVGVLYAIDYMLRQLISLFPGQRLSSSSGSGGTCFDNLFSCQYDSILISIMPTSIDVVEQMG